MENTIVVDIDNKDSMGESRLVIKGLDNSADCSQWVVVYVQDNSEYFPRFGVTEVIPGTPTSHLVVDSLQKVLTNNLWIPYSVQEKLMVNSILDTHFSDYLFEPVFRFTGGVSDE